MKLFEHFLLLLALITCLSMKYLYIMLFWVLFIAVVMCRPEELCQRFRASVESTEIVRLYRNAAMRREIIFIDKSELRFR